MTSEEPAAEELRRMNQNKSLGPAIQDWNRALNVQAGTAKVGLGPIDAYAAQAVAPWRARVEQAEADRDAIADELSDLEAELDELLPAWEHVHASGDTDEQNLLERVATTVDEWRREKARGEKAKAERDEARAQLKARHREDQRWVGRQVKAALEKQAGQIEAWKALAEARDRALADMYALYNTTVARADAAGAEAARLRALIGETNNDE